MPKLSEFLQNRLQLILHPRKVEIRKLRQGIDFLGYVTLPHYRVLRTKTKKRMFKKIFKEVEECNRGEIDDLAFNQSLFSYLGMLAHCKGYGLETKLENEIWLNKKLN